jgi:hypothetical protein
VLGKAHPDTLGSINNIAESLRKQGKCIEAEAIYRETLQLRETVLEKDHPDTLTSINNLTLLLHQQAGAIHQRADLKSEHPQEQLDTTARKKRKAECEDNWDPCTRIKEAVS